MGLAGVRLQPRMTRASQSQPLAGRRIVVTRARAQADDLAGALAALGAEVIAAPVIRIEPLADLTPLRAALADLSRYTWIVFTSRNTVDVVCDRLAEWGIAPAALAAQSVAAIGPATAEALAQRGIPPALVPPKFVAESVVEALAACGSLAGARVLLPRAEQARDALPEGLRSLGALVDVIPVYRTVGESGNGAALAGELKAGRVDAVTFTSSSTVQHFVELVGRDAATASRYAAAVIGPVTAATARELGLPVAIEAAEYTAPGLVQAIVRHFAGGG